MPRNGKRVAARRNADRSKNKTALKKLEGSKRHVEAHDKDTETMTPAKSNGVCVSDERSHTESQRTGSEEEAGKTDRETWKEWTSLAIEKAFQTLDLEGLSFNTDVFVLTETTERECGSVLSVFATGETTAEQFYSELPEFGEELDWDPKTLLNPLEVDTVTWRLVKQDPADQLKENPASQPKQDAPDRERTRLGKLSPPPSSCNESHK